MSRVQTRKLRLSDIQLPIEPGELGVMFNPSKDNDRLTMQLGVQGYVGMREGISGSLKLQYAF